LVVASAGLARTMSDQAMLVVVASASEAGRQFNVTDNVDIRGKDCCGSPWLDFSAEDCAAKCLSERHCMGWTMQVNVSACWLKYVHAR
jgi:hypothetical protein